MSSALEKVRLQTLQYTKLSLIHLSTLKFKPSEIAFGAYQIAIQKLLSQKDALSSALIKISIHVRPHYSSIKTKFCLSTSLWKEFRKWWTTLEPATRTTCETTPRRETSFSSALSRRNGINSSNYLNDLPSLALTQHAAPAIAFRGVKLFLSARHSRL